MLMAQKQSEDHPCGLAPQYQSEIPALKNLPIISANAGRSTPRQKRFAFELDHSTGL
jgi:hypothetical protein